MDSLTTGTGDILARAMNWLDAGEDVALATVISTWGSSPRTAGSQMVIRQDGDFTGSVSGGCIEIAVIEEAMRVIEEQHPADLEFGVSDEKAWSVGLSCGGRIRVRIESMRQNRNTWRLLLNHVEQRRACVLVNRLDNRQHQLIKNSSEGNWPRGDRHQEEIAAALATGDSRMVDDDTFLRPYLPPPRLLIVGAVHISQVLAPMAKACEFEVMIIDPRRSFATDERFESVPVVNQWPEDALKEIVPDRRTSVVALSHDPKIDDPALAAALLSDACYIGALGSRRTHAKRCERLCMQGVDRDSLSRIHAPVGLDIGARTPAEIAAAILAEIIAVRRGSSSP